MDPFDEANFLTYLKKHYPHLYCFEANIRRVAGETGFGDASVTCIVRNGKVFSWDSTFWVKHLSAENNLSAKAGQPLPPAENGGRVGEGSGENPKAID